MIDETLEKAILAEMHHLEIGQQKKVLEYTRSLAQGSLKGVAGKQLLRFAGSIDKDDLQKMTESIEDCRSSL